MITINYQTYGQGFNLRLRLYQNGETKYINVNKLLQGSLLKRHWNQKKQSFIPSAPFSKENNEILTRFKHKYDQKAIDWTGSLTGFMACVDGDDIAIRSKKPTMPVLFQKIVEECKKHKHDDGTVKGTYENYEKCDKRLREYCKLIHVDYASFLVEDCTSTFINKMFDWINENKNGKGLVYISKTLHAALVRADEWGWFRFDRLKGVTWAKKKLGSSQKYNTLTPAQCKRFAEMTPKELPQNPKKFLYRDFCIFLLYTGQSPCDAISLKYSDIQTIDGTDYFVFKRRKIDQKQTEPCLVPINDKMREIMNKWKTKARNGYIFPIRNEMKLRTQKTNDGDIKHFNGRLNNWLKRLGKILGCDFPLHTYTFRHTAITNYISNDVPAVYVANMMGTSVENCEKIYYNNKGDSVSRDKVLNIKLGW